MNFQSAQKDEFMFEFIILYQISHPFTKLSRYRLNRSVSRTILNRRKDA